jgi:excisionase family DNA binding protein
MTNPGDLLLIEEVAAIARVSPETVRFWIKRKLLPSLRPGRRRLIRREALEVFLAAQSPKRFVRR